MENKCSHRYGKRDSKWNLLSQIQVLMDLTLGSGGLGYECDLNRYRLLGRAGLPLLLRPALH
jgi:hypothetical protein